MNKRDLVDDLELSDLVEIDLCARLTCYGYPCDTTPVIGGSAKQTHDDPSHPAVVGCIDQLLGALVQSIPDPLRVIDTPLLRPIQNACSITGCGPVVTGKIEQGSVHAGGRVQILGLMDDLTTDVVIQVESLDTELTVRNAGENVGCLLWTPAYDAV